MDQNPLTILATSGIALYVLHLWIQDLRAHRNGSPHPKAIPGAVPAPAGMILGAIVVAVLIVILETLGEIALGVDDEQSEVTGLFLLAMLSAGIIEEVIFRGYLVVTDRGRSALIGSCLLFSLLFAALHPFLWEYSEAGFRLTLDRKGAFSTGIVFLNSLWFYACRFAPWNPSRSLLPCFAAHIASNLAVFGVKAVQGFVTAPW